MSAFRKADPNSLFNFTKKMLTLRKEIPALCRGDFVPMETPDGMLAYLRRKGDQSVLVAMNFSKRETRYIPPPGQVANAVIHLKGISGYALLPVKSNC